MTLKEIIQKVEREMNLTLQDAQGTTRKTKFSYEYIRDVVNEIYTDFKRQTNFTPRNKVISPNKLNSIYYELPSDVQNIKAIYYADTKLDIKYAYEMGDYYSDTWRETVGSPTCIVIEETPEVELLPSLTVNTGRIPFRLYPKLDATVSTASLVTAWYQYPNITYPETVTSVTGLTVTIGWNECQFADEYVLQYATVLSMDSTTDITTTTALEYITNMSLTGGDTYYFRVMAVNTDPNDTVFTYGSQIQVTMVS